MRGRIIDLSMPIEEGMQTFPAHWHPFVEVTQLGRHGIEDRETHKIVLGTHTGTHIDAPRHFIPGGATIDEADPSVLVGVAANVDLTRFGPLSEVQADDLASALDGLPRERILLRFGWDSRLGTNSYYQDLPFLSEGAAHWLVENGCKLLGMDTPMADNPANGRGSPNDSPIHKILLGNNVLLLEYLVNLGELSGRTVHLVAAPLKIRGADGAPARVFAWTDD